MQLGQSHIFCYHLLEKYTGEGYFKKKQNYYKNYTTNCKLEWSFEYNSNFKAGWLFDFNLL